MQDLQDLQDLQNKKIEELKEKLQELNNIKIACWSMGGLALYVFGMGRSGHIIYI